MSRGEYARLGIGPARIRLRDLLGEAARSVAQHPARSLLTAVGTTLGAAAFIATLGLTSTLSQQVSSEFDAHRATEVLVRPPEGADATAISPDGLARLRALNGVEHAGIRRTAEYEVTVRRMIEEGSPGTRAQVIAADPDAVAVMDPTVTSGRPYDWFHEDEAVPVALLSRPVADRLGIGRAGSAVFIGEQAVTVIGIFTDVARREEALVSILVPLSATGVVPDNTPTDVVVEVAPGAAQQVARQAPLALSPADPDALEVVAPPDPERFRRRIEDDVAQQSLVLSLVAFGIGTVSIANSATASVYSRIPEIGLRRAVGARPRHVFAQLVAETCALGTVGGLVGVLLGMAGVSILSAWNGWAPILDLRLAALAVAGGSLTGLLAGLVPAVRATRIDPVVALQR